MFISTTTSIMSIAKISLTDRVNNQFDIVKSCVNPNITMKIHRESGLYSAYHIVQILCKASTRDFEKGVLNIEEYEKIKQYNGMIVTRWLSLKETQRTFEMIGGNTPTKMILKKSDYGKHSGWYIHKDAINQLIMKLYPPFALEVSKFLNSIDTKTTRSYNESTDDVELASIVPFREVCNPMLFTIILAKKQSDESIDSITYMIGHGSLNHANYISSRWITKNKKCLKIAIYPHKETQEIVKAFVESSSEYLEKMRNISGASYDSMKCESSEHRIKFSDVNKNWYDYEHINYIFNSKFKEAPKINMKFDIALKMFVNKNV